MKEKRPKPTQKINRCGEVTQKVRRERETHTEKRVLLNNVKYS